MPGHLIVKWAESHAHAKCVFQEASYEEKAIGAKPPWTEE